MSTYTIPADVVLPSKVGAVVHLAVPGECSGHCGPRLDCCEVPHDPPPVLADLVGKQCETCDGDGYIDFDTDGYQGPCSACAGSGFALVELVRECERRCIGKPRGYVDQDGIGRRCDCNDGTVSLGRWKVKALRRVTNTPPPPDGDGDVVVCLDPGGDIPMPGRAVECCYVESRDAWYCRDITITGTPEPGGYVAELELVVAP